VQISVPIDALPNGYQDLLAQDGDNFAFDEETQKQVTKSKTPRLEKKQRVSKVSDYKHGSLRSDKGKLFGIFQKSKTTNEDMMARMGNGHWPHSFHLCP
jgi:hypothetical protein